MTKRFFYWGTSQDCYIITLKTTRIGSYKPSDFTCMSWYSSCSSQVIWIGAVSTAAQAVCSFYCCFIRGHVTFLEGEGGVTSRTHYKFTAEPQHPNFRRKFALVLELASWWLKTKQDQKKKKEWNRIWLFIDQRSGTHRVSTKKEQHRHSVQNPWRERGDWTYNLVVHLLKNLISVTVLVRERSVTPPNCGFIVGKRCETSARVTLKEQRQAETKMTEITVDLHIGATVCAYTWLLFTIFGAWSD